MERDILGLLFPLSGNHYHIFYLESQYHKLNVVKNGDLYVFILSSYKSDIILREKIYCMKRRK